jgi:hypothetical protein
MKTPDFDRHIESSGYHEWTGIAKCADGHSWTVIMFNEYGGSFFAHEDRGLCPECSKECVGDVIWTREGKW